jgi:endonuclease/exonuclease/phosphatase family metal-dependent hydrolase
MEAKRMNKNFIGILLATLCFGAAQGMTPSIKVMSYNIRREGPEKAPDRVWADRKARVIALCKSLKPDIIGFQEVTSTQLNDLQEGLSNYNIIATKGRGPSWFGYGADEANPIAYNQETVQCLDQGIFPINNVESWYGWMPWDVSKTGTLPRICTWAKFKSKQTNNQFFVYNTHLDHQYETARIPSVAKIMQEVQYRTKGEAPVIITGDMNSQIEGEIQNAFDGFKHVREIAAKSDDANKPTSTGWQDDKLKTIDHILVNQFITKVQSHRVIESDKPYPSDHRPVVAEIELN